MARQLTFRVDAVDGVTRQNVAAFLERHAATYCVCYEISEKTQKPHYQGWMWTDASEQTMKNRIKKEWPGVASTQRGRTSGKYSCVVVRKPSEYERYCLKGTESQLPDIVCGNVPVGYDLEAEHQKYWSHDAENKPKDQHIVMSGIEHFSTLEWPSDYTLYEKRKDVLLWLLDRYDGRGQNSFLMKNYINGILNKVCPAHRDEFIRQVAYSERF